jgi:hypothetical protein
LISSFTPSPLVPLAPIRGSAIVTAFAAIVTARLSPPERWPRAKEVRLVRWRI